MRLIPCLLAVVSVTAALQEHANILDDMSIRAEDKFDHFKTIFNKVYKDAATESRAMASFIANEKIILDHNAGSHSFILGHNKFSDLSLAEFKAEYLSSRMPAPKERSAVFLPRATADSVDWVAKGAVTPIKDQGRCGSCWAFSAVGAVEGAYQIAGNKLTQFSEESVTLCDPLSMACKGGLPVNAFEHIMKAGIPTEADYPYNLANSSDPWGAICGHDDDDDSDGHCNCDRTKPVAATVSNYTVMPIGDEDALKAFIEMAPTSVGIEADSSAFQLYKSGTFDDASCGNTIDHAVLAVGYGTDSGTEEAYYTVKNSWGTSWGASGYIRMKQGMNICGIANLGSRPTGVAARHSIS
jgi:hypothetical protein